MSTTIPFVHIIWFYIYGVLIQQWKIHMRLTYMYTGKKMKEETSIRWTRNCSFIPYYNFYKGWCSRRIINKIYCRTFTRIINRQDHHHIIHFVRKNWIWFSIFKIFPHLLLVCLYMHVHTYKPPPHNSTYLNIQ